jgi:hypothetical protein
MKTTGRTTDTARVAMILGSCQPSELADVNARARRRIPGIPREIPNASKRTRPSWTDRRSFFWDIGLGWPILSASVRRVMPISSWMVGSAIVLALRFARSRNIAEQLQWSASRTTGVEYALNLHQSQDMIRATLYYKIGELSKMEYYHVQRVE